jgi:hypothetical protein
MAGTNIYDVCIVFSVYATDDDSALRTIAEALPRNRDNMEWAWIYTTLSKREIKNDTDNNNQ